MSLERDRAKQEACERERIFDKHLMPYSEKDMRRIDGEYRYLCTRFYERVYKFFLFIIASIFWRPVLFFAVGFRVRGKENRRGLKGAIAVSNHVHVLDSVMMLALSPHPWKVYHTGAPFNMKKGLRGSLVKWMGYLPLSDSFGAQKNFHHTVRDRLEQGCIVHFYPEHALWRRYEKVRPFKAGAFKYAAKFSVPVLPAFISFERTAFRKFFRMKKRAVLNILPPVYPDHALTERENAAMLQEKSEKAMKECYERIYGKKMTYASDRSEEK